MTVFEQVAQFVVESPVSEIPDLAMNAATESFIDTVGVTFLGRNEPATTVLRGVVAPIPSSGPSWLVTGGSAGPREAAMINATAAHALDFDDATTVDLSGHASAILVPTALAVGQSLGRSGVDALVAYTLGFEVEMWLARTAGPWHFDRGFHPTSTIGIFGATAATARLWGASVSQTTTALAVASSMSSGIKANFGTMTKPLHCGLAAYHGQLAVALAVAGQTANAAAFEDRLGYAAAYAGPGWEERANAGLARLGTAWQILDPGIDLRKLWPVCGSVLTGIEAGVQLHDLAALAMADIEAIEIGLHARRIPQVDRPHPRTGQEARYSVQYAVALAVQSGSPVDDDFREQAILDPEIQALLDRTTLVADARQTARTDQLDGRDLGARVTVTFVDGRQVTAEVDDPIGSPRNPATAEALAEKFEACVAPVLGVDAATTLREALAALVTTTDVRTLPGLRTIPEHMPSKGRS